ncbi:multifunctional CCA tRNA nucleotidyl transferase/2'3'-cyclic phosphodiesterase/2'nucleotidase/phosphatase [Paraphotobacterium marinum]|nr:multifunctional CCA tRNA nucleotidyl transferase/2'3'-cyclic phosphodiesterase/2'nucleotidase/phosphatase [Paraphotobacterium marinum]
MKIYLVGGAVRDQLLGLIPKDNDYVVVGSSPNEMLKKGFKKVGKFFPVFINPQTGNEYALARKEIKKGKGHQGFRVIFSKDISLEEDLLRRDLTINAIAEDELGTKIDPFGGLSDLKNRQLRHISNAFIEDPLRVLRVARFKAQLHKFKFEIAPETMSLMQRISISGELETISQERIWNEWHKSLLSGVPEVFINTLRHSSALSVICPEINQLYSIKINNTNLGSQTERLIKKVRNISGTYQTIFIATIFYLLHSNYEEQLNSFINRIKIPKELKKLILTFQKCHFYFKCSLKETPEFSLSFLEKLNVFRQPNNLDIFFKIYNIENKDQCEETQIYYQNVFKILSEFKLDIPSHIHPNQIKNYVREKKIIEIQSKLH